MKQKHMVLVPYWVESVLKRDRVPFTAILDYAVMRNVLSERELSAFLSFQRLNKIGLLKSTQCGHLLSSWERTCPPDAKAELVSVVVPLSASQDVIDEVMDRMVGDTSVEDGTTQNANLWRLDDFDREALALILQRGAFENTSIPNKGLVLAQALLRVFYEYLDVHEVSALPLYPKYLSLLRSAK